MTQVGSQYYVQRVAFTLKSKINYAVYYSINEKILDLWSIAVSI